MISEMMRTSTGGFRVLVVDDSKIMRTMVIRCLEMSQFQVARVLEAGDGSEALGVLSRESVDLVLSDLHMPTMDGAEMVARMREQPATSSIPVVMVSSQRDEAVESKLRALGVCAYLHKPFQPETLGRILRAALHLEAGT
jgi:two-component system chemotaxis response regulator CheY